METCKDEGSESFKKQEREKLSQMRKGMRKNIPRRGYIPLSAQYNRERINRRWENV